MRVSSLKSILSPTPYTLEADQSVKTALEAMRELGISSIILIDSDSKPIGIFTEHDALKVVAEKIDLSSSLKTVMSEEPFCVDEGMDLHDAYLLMEEKGYRHLVVVNEKGKFLGVVSEGDFLRHIGFEEVGKFKNVSEAMSETPLIVSADTALFDAASLMRERKVDHAVVLEGSTPIGIVTERDIAHQCVLTDVGSLKVQHLLRRDYQIIHQNIPLQEAAALMEKHGIHQLIVVDEAGVLAGLLTRHDVLHAVHGAYFEFLIRVIDQKNETIAKIVERKQQLKNQKEGVEQSVLKLRKLFEIIPDGIVLIENATMKPVEFNAAVYEQLGYTYEEFAQMSIHDYEALESTEETLKRIANIQQFGRDSFETKHRKKSGEVFDVWVNVVAVDFLGVPHMIASYRDITEIKRSEELLIQKQQELSNQQYFLRTLVDTIPDLVWLKDPNGKYLACNTKFEHLYAAKESDIIGKDDFDFVSPELARFFQENDRKAMELGETHQNDEYLVFADGSYEGTFNTIKTPMRDLNGEVIGVLGIARDISERKAKDEEIRRVEALAKIGTWKWKIETNEFTGSDEAYRIFNFSKEAKVTLEEVLSRFHPDEKDKVVYMLMQASKTERQVGSTYRIFDENGQIKWIRTHTDFVYSQEGKPIKAVGIFQDVTEQIQFEKELKRKDMDLSSAQALAHIGSWRLDIQSNLLEWSDETYRIFGLEVGSVIHYSTFLDAIHPDDREKVDLAWQKALDGMPYSIEHRIIVDTEVRWVREQALLETDTKGKLTAGVGTVQDITERKIYEDRLEQLANYDPLTGLSNRGLMMSYLYNSVNQAKRNNSIVAFLMFDLDRFKDINDSYGHSAGDELLKEVAKRFMLRLRDGDMIARLGGDEFAVVLENIGRPESAGRFAKEVIATLSAEYKLSTGAVVHISSSAGIALFPDNAQDGENLLQYADAALYKAKAEGRGTYRYYTDELTDLARNRIECEMQLRRALVNQEFEVYYQPQVHIATGRIVGAEALIRWNSPIRGMVSPVEFIPIAEETGLIAEIGEWVLNETCKQGKIWLDQGHRLTLAVNLSAHQVRHQNIPLMVEKALKQSGYPADRLELEITESALMQREEETVEMLHTLRAHGIRLAIDDFGTGYSSLSYLKRFPIDVLKIDKSFVDDIPFENDDMAIVTAIIAMAEALGFQVLAEGTEREEQIAFLKEKGCTMYQGYFKSPPVPAEAFVRLL